MPPPRLRWINPDRVPAPFPRFQRPAGTNLPGPGSLPESPALRAGVEEHMNGIIYLVGLIVVIMFILSFLGLR